MGSPPLRDPLALWQRYQQYLCVVEPLGLTLDISRMNFDDGYLDSMEGEMQRAFTAMAELEAGAIANVSEKRMVGHYWLRKPELAPLDERGQPIGPQITKMIEDIERFAADVDAGRIKPAMADRFTHVLSIGIGGSSLGPMFVNHALGSAKDKLQFQFIDNTDPDGIARAFQQLGGNLGRTLCLVISKSGGTPETRNGMLAAMAVFREAGIDFARHAVAITELSDKSELFRRAEADKWLARFPMWDWVGGRTSELSAVGLLPAALQGIDIRAMLRGAALCDEATRSRETRTNPAALMALAWHHGSDGRGEKAMVVLPYKDRLELFSRYLQQLIMESLGKRHDLQGEEVNQGLAVYGNKGSTDQHAYVQQLRDGVNNFFVTFIRVLESGGWPLQVPPGVTAGDYLHGFLLGTRQALYENNRESLTLTIPRVDAFTVGGLIALFERTVGFYASLVNINAYDQPGVEAGKKAATAVLDLQRRVEESLTSEPQTAPTIAERIGSPQDVETVQALLEYLAANQRARLAAGQRPGEQAFTTKSVTG